MTRRPRPGVSFSVENIVESIRRHIDPDINVQVHVARFVSNGIVRRLISMVEAWRNQADVNHVTGDVHFLTYFLHKKRTVLTVLDCRGLDGPPTLRRRAFKLLWYTIPVWRCQAIVVISEAVRQDLLKHVRIDSAKVRVIPVAVPSHYKAVPKPFDAEKPLVLHVGTGSNKNLPRLIQALAGMSCRLSIVGVLDEEKRQLLETHLIDYKNYVGLSDSEILARYAESDIVAFASTFEGFGMPIVEANSVGRPVVTSNVSSMPEVAGNAACIVDPFDVQSIRRGIQKVIQDADYRATLVKNGFENARRFEAASIAKKYADLYRLVARST